MMMMMMMAALLQDEFDSVMNIIGLMKMAHLIKC